MSHSPYGRNKTESPKAEPPKSTDGARPYFSGQEPGPFKTTAEEAALVIACREAAERFGVKPEHYMLTAARVVWAASDTQQLAAELVKLWNQAQKSGALDGHAQLVDAYARLWLECRGAPKKNGKPNPLRLCEQAADPPNPDAGHGAADGFGGTDFPEPGPDEGRPQ